MWNKTWILSPPVIWGLFDLFLLFPFVFAVFKQDNKRWWVWLGVALVCTCFSARFSILCVPFIALGVGYCVDKYLLKWFSIKTLLILCFLLICCWNVALFMQHPTQNEMSQVQRFVTDCKISVCYNDWSLGWWITSQGGVTTFKGGLPNPSYSSLEKPFLALTSLNLDCNLIETQGIVNYYSC